MKPLQTFAVPADLMRLQLQARMSAAVVVFAEILLGLAGTVRRRVTGRSHTCAKVCFWPLCRILICNLLKRRTKTH